jgi:hypothetical protein
VRRTSDSITRQSLKAIEGLSGQADMLKNVSENLLQQVSSVTNRFDSHGKQIVNAASALESANSRIDSALQQRHSQLSDTLHKLSGKTEQLDRPCGLLGDGEGFVATRGPCRQLIQQLALTTHARLPSPRSTGCVCRPMRIRKPWCPPSSAWAWTDVQSRPWSPRSSGSGPPMRRPRALSRTCGPDVGCFAGGVPALADLSRFNETSDDLRRRRRGRLQAEQEHLRTEAGVACCHAPSTDAMGGAQRQLRLQRDRTISGAGGARRPACTSSRSACAPR